MKHLKYISPIPFILLIIAAFLPFVEHRESFGDLHLSMIWIERGIDFKMVYLPIGMMLLILLVANIKRTRFTAIVSFVLCFGLILSIFLMQFAIMPISSYITHTIQIGYPFAFFSALLLMVILLINLVKTFKNSSISE